MLSRRFLNGKWTLFCRRLLFFNAQIERGGTAHHSAEDILFNRVRNVSWVGRGNFMSEGEMHTIVIPLHCIVKEILLIWNAMTKSIPLKNWIEIAAWTLFLCFWRTNQLDRLIAWQQPRPPQIGCQHRCTPSVCIEWQKNNSLIDKRNGHFVGVPFFAVFLSGAKRSKKLIRLFSLFLFSIHHFPFAKSTSWPEWER